MNGRLEIFHGHVRRWHGSGWEYLRRASAEDRRTLSPILCIVKIIKLPVGWRNFNKHYDAHCRQFGSRATTRPNGRETLLCITKP